MKWPKVGDRVLVAKTSAYASRWGTVVSIDHDVFSVRFDTARVDLVPAREILEHRSPDQSIRCPSCGDACGKDNCGAAAGNRCCDDCPTLKDLY